MADSRRQREKGAHAMPFRTSPPPSAAERLEDPVVLRTYLALHEAELARTQLEGHEITASIEDAGVAGVHPWIAGALGGVRLMVSAEDAPRAGEVLDALATAVSSAEQGRSEDERLTDEADAAARRAMASAGFGFFLVPVLAHVYSVYLVARIDRRRLSAVGRRRVTIALAIDAVVFAVTVWLVAR